MANETHLLLNLRGDYVDTDLSAETWQCGIRWRGSNTGADTIGTLPDDFAPAAATINRDETNWTITGNWLYQGPAAFHISVDDWLNDQVAPAAATMIGNARFSNQVRLLRLDVYPIGTNGRAVPAPPYASGTPVSLVWKSGSEPKGSGSASVLPLQISCVNSFRTAQIGRVGRGRIYLPPFTTASLTADGHFASSLPADVAGFVSTFLTSATIDSSVTSTYVSPIVTGAPWTKYAVINACRVGDVPDTQRRRRRQLDETYSSVAVPHP